MEVLFNILFVFQSNLTNSFIYFRMATLVPQYSIVNDTISFILLDSLLRTSISSMNAFIDQIGFKCDISPRLTYVTFFTSFCNDFGPPETPTALCLFDQVDPAGSLSSTMSDSVMPFANYTNSCFQSELWFCPLRDYHVRASF
jgi:hypothetical protein